MILDSSYLFDLSASDPDAFDKGVEMAKRGEIQWIPTPVVAEAYYGAATARSDTDAEDVRNRLLGYPRIDVNEEIARLAGRLLADADDRAGGDSGVGPNDAYVAAIGDVLNETVLTANVADFETLGVEVETY